MQRLLGFRQFVGPADQDAYGLVLRNGADQRGKLALGSRQMRALRFGSYSMLTTLAGTSCLFRLKSMMR